MCIFGNNAADAVPAAPPRLPEAPKAPVTSSAGNIDADKRRRAAAAGTSTTGTILTGAQGVAGPATTTQKTLLGS